MTPERPDTNALLARAKKPSEDAPRLHPFYRGKRQTALKCPVRDFGDFAIWYTPSRSMRDARETTRLLMRAGLIPEPPEGA